MNEPIGRVFSFENRIVPNRSAFRKRPPADIRNPEASTSSRADPRVVPEHNGEAQSYDRPFGRNAGSIACDHPDRKAMKAVADLARLGKTPDAAIRQRRGADDSRDAVGAVK